MNFQCETDFLTPQNSFIAGMGSVINIDGNYFDYNSSSSAEEADKKAIFMDWKMIGEDIKKSINSFVQK
jgi:hypothetical protein